ncbi:MAG: hypothetical protein ACLUNS_10485 [Alistipes shahii]
MHRALPHLGLFAAAVPLQDFLFDSLVQSSIYLEIRSSTSSSSPCCRWTRCPWWCSRRRSLALGVTMDCVMGAAGINTTRHAADRLRRAPDR